MTNTKTKIMKFFEDNTEFDYTVRDVGMVTGINFNIAKTMVTELEREGFLVKIRERGYNNRWSAASPVHSYQRPSFLTEERRKQELERVLYPKRRKLPKPINTEDDLVYVFSSPL